MSKVWIVKAGESNEGLDIAVGDDRQPLVFADTEAGYAKAFDAWRKLVKDRIGTNATYSYPGEIGHMARVDVIASGGGWEDYPVDIVELRSFVVWE